VATARARRHGRGEFGSSTEAVPAAEQFAYWRDIVCQTFLPVQPRRGRSDAEGFAGTIAGRAVGPLTISRISSQAQRVCRTRRLIERDAGDTVYLNVQLRGQGRAAQDGRRASQRPGEMAIVDGTRPFELEFDGDFEQLCVTFPVELLAPRLALPQAMSAVRIPGDEGLGGLLVAQLRYLTEAAGSLDRQGASLVADRLVELTALSLGRASSLPRSAGAALLLQAALDDVERNLGDPDLAPAAVAARVNVSTRYLHRLFAEQGTSFGRWVLRRRLERCRQDLADPALAHLTISQIAERWGFRDRSHFARAFRARYQLAPREWRRGR
jgi:AraC-like DNA-binding protein